MSETLYIVIPAYNEEMNVEAVAREWHSVVESVGGESRLVIIDDGSKDGTYNKLLELKKTLPRLDPRTKTNGGHGATVLFGYNYALANNADYVFMTDADGQTIAAEFGPFWKERAAWSAIIGHRTSRQDGFSRVCVTKTLKFVLWAIFGLRIADANTPFRLIKASVLAKYVKRIPKDFNLSNVMLTVLLLDAKEPVKFVPITFRPRQGGVNSINLRRIARIGRQAVKDFRAIKREMKEADRGEG
jgi:dolichol-phosphate mannosyltransferase